MQYHHGFQTHGCYKLIINLQDLIFLLRAWIRPMSTSLLNSKHLHIRIISHISKARQSWTISWGQTAPQQLTQMQIDCIILLQQVSILLLHFYYSCQMKGIPSSSLLSSQTLELTLFGERTMVTIVRFFVWGRNPRFFPTAVHTPQTCALWEFYGTDRCLSFRSELG